MLDTLLSTGIALYMSLVPATSSVPTPTAPTPVVAEPDAAKTIVVDYDRCMRSCDTPGSRATDRHTCMLTCELVAQTGMESLDNADAFQAGQSMEWSDGCHASCDRDRMSTEDRATCHLTCTDAAETLCGRWTRELATTP